jgi:uncharacterized repeat protein (TIGR02543 family)
LPGEPTAVTAIRIAPALNSSYTIPKGCSLKVTVTAQLAEGYNIPYLIGYDSFGFSGTVGAAPVTAEPLTLGVRTHVPYNRLFVTKVLNDPTASPRHAAYAFHIKVNGQYPDENGGIQSLTFDNLKRIGGKFQQTIEAKLLEHGVLPTAVETNNPAGYKTPSIPRATQGATDQYGNTTYYITVTNEPNLHNVYYDANGGGGAQYDSITYYRGDSVNILDRGSMYRSGYTFVGWNTQRDGSGYAFSENQANALIISGTVVLYAQWKANNVPPPIVDPEDPDDPPLPPTVTTTDPVTEPEQLVPDAPDDPEEFAGQTGNPLLDLINGNVPAGDFTRSDCWSLLSMILSIIGVLITICLAFAAARRSRRRQDEDESAYPLPDDEEEKAIAKRRRQTNVTRGIAMILGVLVIVVWLLLDDLTLPMAWVNKWTLYVILTFFVHFVFLMIHKRTAIKEDNADTDEEIAA